MRGAFVKVFPGCPIEFRSCWAGIRIYAVSAAYSGGLVGTESEAAPVSSRSAETLGSAMQATEIMAEIKANKRPIITGL